MIKKRLIWCFTATFGSGILAKFIMGNAAKGDWYLNLTKPSFAPPKWIYGIVWPVLYLVMAIAAFIIWEKSKSISKDKGLQLFFVQLALNPLWIYLFFVKHNLEAAAYLIILIAACAWTVTYLFSQKNKEAAYWLLPYTLWISYAAALSYQYYQLNV